MIALTKIFRKQTLRKISFPLFVYFVFAITALPIYSKLNESADCFNNNSANESSLHPSSEFIISLSLVDRNFERLVSSESVSSIYNTHYLNQHFYNNNGIDVTNFFNSSTTFYSSNNHSSQTPPRSPPLFLM